MSYDPNQPPPYQPSGSQAPASPAAGSPSNPSQPSYPPPPSNYGDQGYGTPGGYPNQPVVAQGNGLAIAGFVVSLVSIFIGGIILGPIAIILSAIGLQRANRGARYKGLAIAGIVIGSIMFILAIIGLILLSTNGFMNY